MEQEDISRDDLLGELIRRCPLDSPSDGFVDRVMANIQVAPETAVARRSFLMYLKAAVPYLLISLLLYAVFATSDLPVFSWLPGKEVLIHDLFAYLGGWYLVLKNAFSSQYISWIFLITIPAAIIYIIDKLFSRRISY